jgi:hypothetical protein
MGGVDDLVAFLRARIDEDEQIARAATPGPWRHDPTKHHHIVGTPLFEEAVFAGERGASAVCVAGTGETDDRQSMADAAHIARHDPARGLREVRAKRGALAMIVHLLADDDTDETARWMLCLLAFPYADHPDYRDEWRP